MSVADEKWMVDSGGTVVDGPGVKVVIYAYAGSEQEREAREREVARLVAMAPELANALRPLAKACREWSGSVPSSAQMYILGRPVGLTVMDLERALAVLGDAGVL